MRVEEELPRYPPLPQSPRSEYRHAPILKSTKASRQSEYEADTDELDEHDPNVEALPTEEVPSSDMGKEADLSAEHEEGPLLHGLISEGLRRQSLDVAADFETNLWMRKGGGLLAGIANMSNSILGAGIVGLPFALTQSGFVSGLILLVVLGVVTDWTIRLIVYNAKLAGQSTYIDIMAAAFGVPGRAMCSLFQFTFAFGGMCAFSIILGDTLPSVLMSLIPDSWHNTGFFVFIFSRQFVIIFFTLSISYPLSLYRDIEKLSRASGMALVSMLIILLVVSIRGPELDVEYQGPSADRWTFIKPGIPSAIGVISFAYVCHHNSRKAATRITVAAYATASVLIYGSLSIPTLDRFDRLTHISTGFSVLASLGMAVCGYTVFTSKTQGNILNNFPRDDLWANLGRLCFGANMFATLPLECFVCREVFETFFFSGQAFDRRRHILFTTALVIVSMTVSLFTSDLGAVLEFAGGCGAAFLAYVFPAASYLRLSSDLTPFKRWSAISCVTFGITVASLVAGRVLWRTFGISLDMQ